MGTPLPEIRAAVRTGDTMQPQSGQADGPTQPPHILITTPESLFILLTSESGRPRASAGSAHPHPGRGARAVVGEQAGGRT